MTAEPLLAAQFFVPESLDESRGLDRVIIRDLLVTARIGVHAHEHLAPQRVRINVELRVRTRSGEADDDIRGVVSYEHLVTGIRRIIERRHINLVESLAEEVARLCLRDERAASVSVRVEKPDIEPDAAGVGVEIERQRPVAPPAKLLLMPDSPAAPRRASSGDGET